MPDRAAASPDLPRLLARLQAVAEEPDDGAALTQAIQKALQIPGGTVTKAPRAQNGALAPFAVAVVTHVTKQLASATRVAQQRVLAEIAWLGVSALEARAGAVRFKPLDRERLLCNLLTRLADAPAAAPWAQRVAACLHARLAPACSGAPFSVTGGGRQADASLALVVAVYFVAALRLALGQVDAWKPDTWRAVGAQWAALEDGCLGWLTSLAKLNPSAFAAQFDALARSAASVLSAGSLSASAVRAIVAHQQLVVRIALASGAGADAVLGRLVRGTMRTEKAARAARVCGAALQEELLESWARFGLGEIRSCHMADRFEVLPWADVFWRAARQDGAWAAVGASMELFEAAAGDLGAKTVLRLRRLTALAQSGADLDVEKKLEGCAAPEDSKSVTTSMLQAIVHASDELVAVLHRRGLFAANAAALKHAIGWLSALVGRAGPESVRGLQTALVKRYEMAAVCLQRERRFVEAAAALAGALERVIIGKIGDEGHHLVVKLAERHAQLGAFLQGNPFESGGTAASYIPVASLINSTSGTEAAVAAVLACERAQLEAASGTAAVAPLLRTALTAAGRLLESLPGGAREALWVRLEAARLAWAGSVPDGEAPDPAGAAALLEEAANPEDDCDRALLATAVAVCDSDRGSFSKASAQWTAALGVDGSISSLLKSRGKAAEVPETARWPLAQAATALWTAGDAAGAALWHAVSSIVSRGAVAVRAIGDAVLALGATDSAAARAAVDCGREVASKGKNAEMVQAVAYLELCGAVAGVCDAPAPLEVSIGGEWLAALAQLAEARRALAGGAGSDAVAAWLCADSALRLFGRANRTLVRVLRQLEPLRGRETLSSAAQALAARGLASAAPQELLVQTQWAFAVLAQAAESRGQPLEAQFVWRQLELFCRLSQQRVGFARPVAVCGALLRRLWVCRLASAADNDDEEDGGFIGQFEALEAIVEGDTLKQNGDAENASRLYKQALEMRLQQTPEAAGALDSTAVGATAAARLALTQARQGELERAEALCAEYADLGAADDKRGSVRAAVAEYLVSSAFVKLSLVARALSESSDPKGFPTVGMLLSDSATNSARPGPMVTRLGQARAMLDASEGVLRALGRAELVCDHARLRARHAVLAQALGVAEPGAATAVGRVLAAADCVSVSREQRRLRAETRLESLGSADKAVDPLRAPRKKTVRPRPRLLWPSEIPWDDVFASDGARALPALPPWLAVCVLSVDRTADVLYVTRFSGTLSTPAVVAALPLRRRDPSLSFIAVMDELDAILRESNATTHLANASAGGAKAATPAQRQRWWQTRQQLDARLERLLARVDSAWFGGFAGILAPGGLDDPLAAHLANCNPTEADWSELALATGRSVESLCSTGKPFTESQNTPGHLVLVPDKHLHGFPWESLATLTKVPVSRVPSLKLLAERMADAPRCWTLRPERVRYVLNPDGDLDATERQFAPLFKQIPGSSGTLGERPCADNVADALGDSDVFLYFGHGSGEQYLGGQRVRRLERCAAAAVLMGCSSGRLVPQGDYDPAGTVLNYMTSPCRAVVANLWDVTDRDLDRFSEAFLDAWGLFDVKRGHVSLAAAAAEARSRCKLVHLVGAAPVVYGLPLFLDRSGPALPPLVNKGDLPESTANVDDFATAVSTLSGSGSDVWSSSDDENELVSWDKRGSVSTPCAKRGSLSTPVATRSSRSRSSRLR